VGRRRFRDDDDVDALGSMYKNTEDDDEGEFRDNNEDEDGDGEEHAAEVTAAEFFGQPRKASEEYLKKLQTEGKEDRGKNVKDEDDDADSWNDHDFEGGEDWRDTSKDDKPTPPRDDGDDDENGVTTLALTDTDTAVADPTVKLSAHALKTKKLHELTLRLESETLAEKPGP